MSRNLIAIVGTLAFALPGAASAGQVNIPHININIPRPQISVLTPHPNIPTPHLSISPPRISAPHASVPKATARAYLGGLGSPGGSTIHYDRAFGSPGGSQTVYPADRIGTLPGNGTGSASGSASAMPVSNTGGGSYASSGGGGYSTVGKANASPSFRCRSKGGVSNCPG